MKKVKSIEAYEASADTYRSLRHEPLIIKNDLNATIRDCLSWHNIQKSVPNLTVQLTESLANIREGGEYGKKIKFYCKLHDYISYCQGGRVHFTIQTGPFDVKVIELDRIQKKLYLLSLNCDKNPMLTPLVTLDSRYGDWFEEYFPEYTKEIVYNKGHTWFFIGPEDTESELHSDHNFVHTTLQQCDGSKEVFLVDPTTTTQLISEYGMAIRFKVRNGVAVLCHKKKEIIDKAVDEKIRHGIIEPGDTLYIPFKWGHMVRAKSKSITVSRDFIDERNAGAYFTSMCRRVER